MKKILKIIFFMTVLAILSLSVNAHKIPDSWQYIGMACSPGGYYGDCPCELVCKNENGIIPQSSSETGTCQIPTMADRKKLATEWDDYGNPRCCVIATGGGWLNNAPLDAPVQKNQKIENSQGEVYVFPKGAVMDWAEENSLNLPKSYPFLTLNDTPVSPYDVCDITYMNEYPPWSSSNKHNYGCYNLVPCTEPGDPETHYVLIKIHPGVNGTGINPEYVDGLQRDVCQCQAAPDIWRTLHFFNGIRTNNGRNVGTDTKTFIGSELELLEPQFIDWTDTSEVYYPFVFTSNDIWEINVSLYVPEGLEVVGSNSVFTLIANESKIILFKVKELIEGAGESAGAAVLLDIEHEGKIQKDVSVISSAAVKKGEPAKVTMQVKPAEGETQKAETEIANIEEGQVSSEFLLFAGVALIIIIAIALYMSLMKKK